MTNRTIIVPDHTSLPIPLTRAEASQIVAMLALREWLAMGWGVNALLRAGMRDWVEQGQPITPANAQIRAMDGGEKAYLDAAYALGLLAMGGSVDLIADCEAWVVLGCPMPYPD